MTTKPFLRFINLYGIAFIEVFLETGICLVALKHATFAAGRDLGVSSPKEKEAKKARLTSVGGLMTFKEFDQRKKKTLQ